MDIITFLNASFSLVSNFMSTANFAFEEDKITWIKAPKKKTTTN